MDVHLQPGGEPGTGGRQDVRYPSGWTFIPHALHRMDEMGVLVNEVHATLADPVLTYPGRPGPKGQQRQIRVRDRLAVVVAPADRSVITVLWHGATGRRTA